jgi:hypothetical protein
MILKKISPKKLTLWIRIWDPDKIHPRSRSRIQGVKKHRIPDPDPQNSSSPDTNLVSSDDRYVYGKLIARILVS